MIDFRFTCALLFLLTAPISLNAADVDFDRDVRPILSDKCYQCHGPDAATREADLRLDTQEGAFANLEGRFAFRAGDVEKSEALKRINASDAEERMPPPSSKLVLSDVEKQVLRKWVEKGAPWGNHWAFVAPVKHQPPTVKQTTWPRNEIDRFVLARLESESLTPAAEASRETLIRRVTLDLTGLPPTPDEVTAFLSDTSPEAYDRVVDRLLKSPAYGERMAWEWLDAARYADTDGFQGDPTRTMWPWRDWLIQSLNDNLPFDQFTIQMLAGDLLPQASTSQIIATGFNRNHMHNGEGGRIAEETRIENVFDRTETTATIWMGLTYTCCRCHDHKFDPISQREYYQLFAFFNNTSENGARGGGKAPPVLKYHTPEQLQQTADITQRLAALSQQLQAPLPKLDEAQTAWEIATLEKLQEASNANKLELSDWSVVGTLPAPQGNGAKTFDHDFGTEKQVDLKQKFADGKFAWRTESKFKDGHVHPLPEDVGVTYLFRTLTTMQANEVEASLGSDDGIKVWLNGEQLLAKNVARAAAADQEKITLKLREGRNELLLKIVNTGGIGGFYFQLGKQSSGGIPDDVKQALAIEVKIRNEKQRLAIQQHYRSQHWADWAKLTKEQTALEQKRDQLEKAAALVMIMDELPANSRRTSQILFRGIYNKPEATVKEGTPSFLPPLPANEPLNRLTLAKWLVDPQHPLTARVTVNRYWQMFFGKALVETSEDFGRQGSRPSHPELLDWLALQFVESGWDVKALHKLIVTSATYRQSSQAPASYQADPDNRLLSRGSRFRLPSWMMRDQALAVSGLMASQVGGPSVFPYQPPGIWAEATFGKIRYQQGSGDSLYRRSLYIFWRRIVGPTMFFDSAKRQTCEVKPTRTNTPLHALTTLNETTFVEASRALAQRVLKSNETTLEGRLTMAFRYVTARSPQPAELELLARRWKISRQQFAEQPEQAKELLSVGASPRDSSLDAADHAALAVVCAMLLNLDETLTRE